MTDDNYEPESDAEVKSGRIEITEGPMRLETWHDEINVRVSEPTFFAPIDGESDAAMSLGFSTQWQEEVDEAQADFAAANVSLTPEQAIELGETLIEKANSGPVGVGKTAEDDG